MRKIIAITAIFLVACILIGCASFKYGTYNRLISAGRSQAGLKPGELQIAGQSLAYLDRAGSGETIILIHGFGANKDNWVRFVKYIPEPYRVIALDMPGHGDSGKDLDKIYSIDYMASCLGQAVDALKIGRFNLAGNSMGGFISLVYTARNPDRVATLCLMDNAGFRNVSPIPSDLDQELAKGKNILIPTTVSEYSVTMEYAFYKAPFIPWPITSVLAEKAVSDSPLKQKIWKDIYDHPVDAAALLPNLRPPVLVIWGDHDRILHVSTTEILKRSLPDSEIIIMKDCGHMPMLERPEETARDYVSFLNKHAKNQ